MCQEDQGFWLNGPVYSTERMRKVSEGIIVCIGSHYTAHMRWD